VRIVSVIAWGILLLIVADAGRASAECRVEKGSAGSATFTVHLSQTCTQAEREAQAVSAQELLHALASGKGIDLAGAVIQGDLFLDELPSQKAGSLKDLTTEDQRLLEGLEGQEVHVIRGPFALKHVSVKGHILNRLKQGFLLVTGPVVLTDTHFNGALDLSRTVFLGVVDGSGATFDQESFFVQDQFTQGAIFSGTKFGPHVRFHRSQFGAPAVFRGASFNGLSEFLEVVFTQDASFARATFHMGTGFSGAECRGKCDFSGARFDREAFFLFARFHRPVTFAEARFGGQADFSDALFLDNDDLAGAWFARPPLLTRTIRPTAAMPGSSNGTASSQAVTVSLFLAALGLLLYLLKSR